MDVNIDKDFNPRSPYGERLQTGVRSPAIGISIHAPHTGSDAFIIDMDNVYSDFNPRSPYGERLILMISSPCDIVFQSTLPIRGATAASTAALACFLSFQSTLPIRGATTGNITMAMLCLFQSTLPIRGATFPLSFVSSS